MATATTSSSPQRPPTAGDDRPSLLESLAARLRAATAQLPERAAIAAAAGAAPPLPPPLPSSPLSVGDLSSCLGALLPFFDHLGPVFHVARGELQSKLDAVRSAAAAAASAAATDDTPPPPLSQLRLEALVAADVAARRETTKGSAARSLHRLGGTLLFIKLLFERLLMGPAEPPLASPRASLDDGDGGGGLVGLVRRISGAGGHPPSSPGHHVITLREAASEAYEKALAPWHTMVVRGVVRAGMLTLPSREHFLASCGETERTARAHATAAVSAAQRLLSEIEHLLRGIKMPASDVWLWPG
jgi:hypothetical protein